MKAEETVMSIPAIKELFKERPVIKTIADLNTMFHQLAQAQAEISFKMGCEQGASEHGAISHLDIHNSSKQEGVKEVVEWIEEHGGCQEDFWSEWHLRIRDWGLCGAMNKEYEQARVRNEFELPDNPYIHADNPQAFEAFEQCKLAMLDADFVQEVKE